MQCNTEVDMPLYNIPQEAWVTETCETCAWSTGEVEPNESVICRHTLGVWAKISWRACPAWIKYPKETEDVVINSSKMNTTDCHDVNGKIIRKD